MIAMVEDITSTAITDIIDLARHGRRRVEVELALGQAGQGHAVAPLSSTLAGGKGRRIVIKPFKDIRI